MKFQVPNSAQVKEKPESVVNLGLRVSSDGHKAILFFDNGGDPGDLGNYVILEIDDRGVRRRDMTSSANEAHGLPVDENGRIQVRDVF